MKQRLSTILLLTLSIIILSGAPLEAKRYKTKSKKAKTELRKSQSKSKKAKSASKATPKSVVAQVGSLKVKWLSEEFDFGTMAEDEGPQKGKFRFVNIGEEPVWIEKVKTSCGCTQAEFVDGMIASGDTATINFSYDPTRRPGLFQKTIRVFLGCPQLKNADPKVLTIKGNVVPSANTLADDYPVSYGDLRLSGRFVDLGRLEPGVARHGFVRYFNPTSRTMMAEATTDHRSLTATVIPDTIAPGEGGVISFYLDTTREPRRGEITYGCYLSIEGQQGEPLLIGVRAQVGDEPTEETDLTQQQQQSSAQQKGKTSEKKGKKKHFSSSYTEIKKIETPEEKEAKKKKWFSNHYTERKKQGEQQPKKKRFSKTYQETNPSGNK